MVNDRDQSSVTEAEAMQSWCAQQSSLRGHVLFSTSGSTGKGKWVALSRKSILASARAVNEHLEATSEDRWLLALPSFHVGGIGIYARCYVASAELVKLEGKWSAARYHALAKESQATLSALVPTQLVDLVNSELESPVSLRALIIGGGHLESSIYKKAISLGWPIMETYGMTETCSQVATSDLGDRALKILPPWHAQLTKEGKLSLIGECIMTGYVSCDNHQYQLNSHEGWFVTGDLVELKGNTLKVISRSDRCVKILGELVDLTNIERDVLNSSVELGIQLESLAMVATPNLRSGHEIIACCIAEDEDSLRKSVTLYHQSCAPFKRVHKIRVVNSIPKSALGKVRYLELSQKVSSDE